MRRLLTVLVVLAIAGAAIFWWVTRPQMAEASVLAGIEPDLERGAARIAEACKALTG